MTLHTIDQIGSPDQVVCPDKRAEIRASYYRSKEPRLQGLDRE
jgi:hypothetical protein